MDWTSLIGPAVIAAGISALVSWFSTSRRFAVDRELAERRIAADLNLAERKFAFDKQLAEHKTALDVNLAEKKFAFEKETVAWRRRYDLAEQILSSAYEARDALVWSRARVVMKGEGETREATGSESPQLKADRDSAFVPVERLTAHAKCFAALQAAQDAAAAHFGSSVVQSISQLLNEHRKIATAAAYLIQHADWNEDRSGKESLKPFRDELWGLGEPGAAKQRVDTAVEQLEAICKPVLLTPGPT